MSAKSLNESYRANLKLMREQSSHMLKNCKEYISHEVKTFVVFDFGDNFFCYVVNKESRHLIVFDSSQDAIDYVLDKYPNAKLNKQTQLKIND